MLAHLKSCGNTSLVNVDADHHHGKSWVGGKLFPQLRKWSRWLLHHSPPLLQSGGNTLDQKQFKKLKITTLHLSKHLQVVIIITVIMMVIIIKIIMIINAGYNS